MKRIFSPLIYFAFTLFAFSVPNTVFAQTDVSVVGEAEADATEGSEASRMLRIDTPVSGYQPLSVAGQEIDAAYLEESYGQRFGAIVLFHDLGKQYETRDVITPLRHELANYGWSTLTLTLDSPSQANVLLSANLEQEPDNQATDSDNSDSQASETQQEKLPAISNEQRIQAAMAFLEAKQIEQIVFLGHGDGGRIAVETLSKTALPISGLILVNTPEIDDEQLQALKLAIFDIYGSNALAGTETAVKMRSVLMKRGAKGSYSARKVIGANHVFYGLDAMLSQHIKGWLKKTLQQGKR